MVNQCNMESTLAEVGWVGGGVDGDTVQVERKFPPNGAHVAVQSKTRHLRQ